MLPASTFSEILNRAEAYAQPRPLRDRLVSIVFANPTSPVWADLKGNHAMLDARSGDSWDLFFAGLSAYSSMPRERSAVQVPPRPPGRKRPDRDEFPGWFNPGMFTQIAGDVEHGQRRALRAADDRRPGWRYSGGTDLVSFMVYGREPDWLSLRNISLYRAARYELDLGHVVEGLRGWQREELDAFLAPGECSPSGLTPSTGVLAAALQWSAGAVAGGVLGNAAFELIRKVVS